MDNIGFGFCSDYENVEITRYPMNVLLVPIFNGDRKVMEELKKALKLQAKLYNADTAYVSISTLDMGRKYPITDLSKVQSAYGLRVLVSLQGDRRILKTYLPKSIKLSDSYVDGFINRDRRSVLYLIYKGVKPNGTYKIDFE